MFQINNGPFKGVAFETQEAYRLAGDPISGEPDKAGIAISALNQRFLDVFSPLHGWSVRFTRQLLPIDMYPLPRLGEVVKEPVPAVEITAELVDAQDRVVNSASTIWTIRGPTEWEKGETNARIRLYEAVGLQARFPLPDGLLLSRAPELPGGTTAAAVVVKRNEAHAKSAEDEMPYFEPVLDTEDEEPQEAAVAATPVVEDNPLGDGPAANRESTALVQRSEPAPAVASNVLPLRSKAKRKQLPDDAPAPEALLVTARNTARLHGKTVPDDVTTKGEVRAFIASLG